MRHTSYEAFRRGFDITVPRDAVCTFEGVDEDQALEYLRGVYGARITTVDELDRSGGAGARLRCRRRAYVRPARTASEGARPGTPGY